MFIVLIMAVILSLGLGVGVNELGLENGFQNAQAGLQNDSNIEFHFLNVSQGDSTLVILPDGKTMLIDTSKKNQGTTIVNYLKNLNISKIDYLVLTHPDDDHIGGSMKVIDNFDIGIIYVADKNSSTATYKEYISKLNDKDLKNITLKTNDTIIESDDFKAIVLSPSKNYSNNNEMSIVIQFIYKNNTVLLMGDAGIKAENDILNSNFNVKADLIKIGHHGSNYSSSANFIKNVAPQFAIISSGENQYGHPRNSTLEILNYYNITFYRTDRLGHIIAISDGNTINITTQNKNGTGVSNLITNYFMELIKIA